MRKKDEKGFVTADVVVSMIAIVIFSVLIFSLMYNNFLENSKVKKDALANLYLCETLEKIGIAKFDDLTQENMSNGTLNLIPFDLEENAYHMELDLIEDLNLSEEHQKDQIIKKIRATISYTIGNKNYSKSKERIKARD